MMEAPLAIAILALVAWAAIADLRTREIPDAIPIALAAIAVLRLGVEGSAIGVSVAAGGALGLAIGTLGFAVGALGGGDAKLAAALGAVLGAGDFVLALAVTGLAGGVGSFVASRRGDPELPYAPAIALGVAAALGLGMLDPTTAGAWIASSRIAVVPLLATGAIVTAIAVRRVALGRRAARRLAAPASASIEARTRRAPDFAGATSPWWPVLVGATVFSVAWIAGATPFVASGIAAVPSILVHLAAARRVERRTLRLEEQLAEAIHLAAAAMRAGASPNDAIERAARENAKPLRPLLEALSQRLRLGEDPDRALAAFAERVPLDTYRLFATAVAVQWRAGGSFDRALRSVARAVGDRVETARRVDTQTASVRASVVAVVVANIAIAGLSAIANPASLALFLRSDVGAGCLAATLWLQALALWWIARLAASVR